MLQTEKPASDLEALPMNTIGEKASTTKGTTTFLPSKVVPMKKSNITDNPNSPVNATVTAKATSLSAENPFEWEEVKKARNRINSQRIRERERAQIANLEAERARLWLSNDAIRFQNRHFREIITKVIEVRELKRSRTNGGIGMVGPGIPTATGTSTALAASLGAAGALGGGSSIQMPPSMRHNTDMINGLGGGVDTTGMFQNRLAASAKSLSGLSDADLLARHQATTLEMQSMVRQQEAMDRLGGGVGMGSLMNNDMNVNGMNMNAASPYASMADNIRIRQLMLQQSGDFEPRGLLSSIGGGASNPLGGSGGGGTGGVDASTGNMNGNGLSYSVSALGDFSGGMGDADLLQKSKRQNFGY